MAARNQIEILVALRDQATKGLEQVNKAVDELAKHAGIADGAMQTVAKGSAAAESGVMAMAKSFLGANIAMAGFNKAMSTISDTVSRGIKSLSDMEQAGIKMAAAFANADRSISFDKAYANAVAMVEVTQQLDKSFVGTADELIFLEEQLVTYGVRLDLTTEKSKRSFVAFANMLKIQTSGQSWETQAPSEVRALLTGENKMGARMAKAVEAQGITQDQIDRWTKMGTLFDEVMARFPGYQAATDKMQGTWEAMTSSANTYFNIILRSGMGTFFEDMKGQINGMNDELSKMEGGGWGEKIADAFRRVWEVVKQLGAILHNLGFDSLLIAAGKFIGFTLKGVGGAIVLFRAFTETVRGVYDRFVSLAGSVPFFFADMARALWDSIRLFGTLGKAVWAALTFDKKGLMEAVANGQTVFKEMTQHGREAMETLRTAFKDTFKPVDTKAFMDRLEKDLRNVMEGMPAPKAHRGGTPAGGGGGSGGKGKDDADEAKRKAEAREKARAALAAEAEKARAALAAEAEKAIRDGAADTAVTRVSSYNEANGRILKIQADAKEKIIAYIADVEAAEKKGYLSKMEGAAFVTKFILGQADQVSAKTDEVLSKQLTSIEKTRKRTAEAYKDQREQAEFYLKVVEKLANLTLQAKGLARERADLAREITAPGFAWEQGGLAEALARSQEEQVARTNKAYDDLIEKNKEVKEAAMMLPPGTAGRGALIKGVQEQMAALEEQRAAHLKRIEALHKESDVRLSEMWADTLSGWTQSFDDLFFNAMTGKFTSFRDFVGGIYKSIAQAASKQVGDMAINWIRNIAEMKTASTGMGFMDYLKAGASLISAWFGGPSLQPTASAPSLSGYGAFSGSYPGGTPVGYSPGLGWANGGIVHGGWQPIHAFASGGIVSSPTLGLVGEGADDEAIIPLKGGKVPVQLKGGSREPAQREPAQNVSVSFNIAAMDGPSVDQLIHQRRGLIAGIVRQEVANAGVLRDAVRKYARG